MRVARRCATVASRRSRRPKTRRLVAVRRRQPADAELAVRRRRGRAGAPATRRRLQRRRRQPQSRLGSQSSGRSGQREPGFWHEPGPGRPARVSGCRPQRRRRSRPRPQVALVAPVVRGGRGGRAGGAAERSLSYGELVGNKGGLTPLLFAAREGNIETVKVLLDAGAPIDQVERGRPHEPAADGHDQRPLRPRQAAARARREPEPDERRRRNAALRDDQRAVGGEVAVSAADGAEAAEDDVPGADGGAAQGRRRS